MDRLMRFSDYDVFAYVASGVIALALLDTIFLTHFVIGAEWTVAQGVLTIFGAYVLGQILASPSAWLLEGVLVRRVLGRPIEILVGALQPSGARRFLARFILRNFYSPLDPSVQTRLRTIMTANNVTTGEGLFWLAFPVVKSEPITYGRLASFLNLYGFARNMAFVLTIGGIALLIAGQSPEPGAPSDSRLLWGAIALMAAVGMIHRYLKFLRLYAVEVLTTFDALERRRK